jgi:hypothetical protein
MVYSHSRKANSNKVSQEVPRLLWEPRVHYSVHNSPQLVPILTQQNSVPTFPTLFLKIISIILSHTYA